MHERVGHGSGHRHRHADELGRIAALSARVDVEQSPLERQVRRVAWVIAAVALGLGIAFVQIAMIGADLPFADAVVFGVGLLVGNVPEGLLPVITLAMLARAWLFVGLIAALLASFAFFRVLLDGGWSLGDEVGAGSPLHDTYRRAVTTTFLAMVVAQVGTAVAARTERSSLRSIGLFTNPLLLWGIAFELALTAAIIYLPPLHALFGTAPLGPDVLLLVAPFPFIVWGADELRRFVVRRTSQPAG